MNNADCYKFWPIIWHICVMIWSHCAQIAFKLEAWQHKHLNWAKRVVMCRRRESRHKIDYYGLPANGLWFPNMFSWWLHCFLTRRRFVSQLFCRQIGMGRRTGQWRVSDNDNFSVFCMVYRKNLRILNHDIFLYLSSCKRHYKRYVSVKIFSRFFFVLRIIDDASILDEFAKILKGLNTHIIRQIWNGFVFDSKFF